MRTKPKTSKEPQLSRKRLAKLFTEWEKRYRANPEKFMSEATKFLKHTPKSYGDRCAVYFAHLNRVLK
jgi:hypothetical protein